VSVPSSLSLAVPEEADRVASPIGRCHRWGRLITGTGGLVGGDGQASASLL